MTLLRNNNIFLDSICLFKLPILNTISEASQILRIHLFSGGANKTCGVSFLSSVLKGVESLETSHILLIAIINFDPIRRCMFV